MKKLKGFEIRQLWLDFWASKGHDVLPSAPLIPLNDPTLLWINSGVAPLKKYFDGREVPKNKRITNAQKSIRTNDIDNVGKTARHHTFFEMLGNFSIGDYFRDEVLPWAIELLTSPKWFDLDINKLYFTYYPTDIKTYELWQRCGIKEDHLVPVEGNFWEIGEGPCGPDTEIFFDRGKKYDKENIGPKLIENDIENDRYIEIWNIVFSQFNSKPGVPRNEYKELPSKNIDTGCGLERVACIMQEVETNYDTDLFMDIINAAEKITSTKYNGQMAFKVIADHTRSTVFALSDGATFSNEGRGYVLRRILRRAVRYGRVLGMNESFLYKLVSACVQNMKVFYPYLLEKEELVTKQIKLEEEKFLSTLESGEKRLLDYIKNNPTEKIINKEMAFQLYDTFGFPFELTLEVALEHGYDVDEKGFKEELQKQKERARKARNTIQSMNVQNQAMMDFQKQSQFLGYDTLETTSKVIGLFKGEKEVKSATGKVLLVCDITPFYAEMGGQIGDLGQILFNGENFDVDDTTKLPNGQHAVIVDMQDTEIKLDDEVKCIVDIEFRKNIEKNHSATHLLNEALREVIGNHVIQQGSYVSNNVLRFDFNHFNMPSNEEISKIEELVNQQIENNYKVNIYETSIEEAKKQGVQAVFGEKYGSIVRVVDMTFSKELCGGTHVSQTNDIKKFAIVGIESKGSGIFRITAATNTNIESMIMEQLTNLIVERNNLENKQKEIINQAKQQNINLYYANISFLGIKESYQSIIDYRISLELLKEEVKKLDKDFQKLQKDNSSIALENYLNQVEEIKGSKVLITTIKDVDIDVAKDFVDRLSDKLGKCIIILAIISDKVVFVVKSKVENIHAGNIAKMAAIATLGNGGGRSDFASAGGKDITRVDEALNIVRKELEYKI